MPELPLWFSRPANTEKMDMGLCKSDKEAAVRRLLDFFAAHNEWEEETNRQYEAIDWENYTEEERSRNLKERKQALARVFEYYCEAGSSARRLRDEGLHHSASPQHDPEREKIVTVTATSEVVQVETYDNATRFYWRYEIVQVDGVWKVRDKRHLRLKPEGRWNKDIL